MVSQAILNSQIHVLEVMSLKKIVCVCGGGGGGEGGGGGQFHAPCLMHLTPYRRLVIIQMFAHSSNIYILHVCVPLFCVVYYYTRSIFVVVLVYMDWKGEYTCKKTY